LFIIYCTASTVRENNRQEVSTGRRELNMRKLLMEEINKQGRRNDKIKKKERT
jgi:hypothetical protein